MYVYIFNTGSLPAPTTFITAYCFIYVAEGIVIKHNFIPERYRFK